MNFKWLKRSRVIVSLLIFLCVFFIFIDIYELIPHGVTDTILYPQFVPSLLLFLKTISFTSLGFISIILLSVFFGRIYCSTICPLGIFQDIISFISKKISKRKVHYKFKKPHSILRYSIVAIVTVTILAGIPFVITILDPYSIAGRFFTYLIKPIVIFFNNVIAGVANKMEWYTIYKIKVYTVPLTILLLNIAFIVTIGYLAYKRGRLFCNTICPVGTFLGLFSKYSLFKINIHSDKCTKCANCASVCKSECIDLKNSTIDYSRCVSCYNCLTVCNDDAIDFKNIKPVKVTSHSKTRRNVITGLFLLSGSTLIKAQNIKTEKKSKTGKTLKPVKRNSPTSPPGSRNIERFNNICTGCGLCVSACPTKVLRPAFTEYGLMGFMQPHMDYSVGECNFDCTICGDICPTGAILPVTKDEKHLLQLGKAKFVKENCIVSTDETACGACSEHCPTKAVNMVPYKGKLLIPKVDESICVGCGSCEHPCPLEHDYKAIYVDGNPEHLEAEKPKEEKAVEIPEEDFPF